MSWIKRALIDNLKWFAFLVILSIAGCWYISTYPLPPGFITHAERTRKLGEIVGSATAWGSLLIWFHRFSKHKRENK